MKLILQLSPAAMFFIMLGVGMSVNFKSFTEVFKVNLKVLFLGLFLQMIILPVTGFCFAIFAPVDLVFKLGIVLITCVPSAVTSNYLSKLVNGNVALSVSLTSITACLSFISIPFILTIITPIVFSDANIFQELNFIKMSRALLFITTVPVLIGIFINTKFSIISKKIKKVYSIFSFLLFLLIILAAWVSEWNVIIDLYKSIGFLVALLAIIVLIISYAVVNLFKLNAANKKTIIIESFIQNAAMAIIVGGAVFGLESGYLAIAALYALLQYKILLFLWGTNKLLKKFDFPKHFF